MAASVAGSSAAPSSQQSPGLSLPPRPRDVDHLASRWPGVIAAVRSDGRASLAGMLEHMRPVALAGDEVTLQLDEPNAYITGKFGEDEGHVRAALAKSFSGIRRLVLRPPEDAAEPKTARRMTAESIRDERLANIRSRDPVLDAAVDALDLELLD